MNIIFACKTIASSRKNLLRDLYNNLITAIKESAHSNLEWIFITCRVYILHVSSLQKKLKILSLIYNSLSNLINWTRYNFTSIFRHFVILRKSKNTDN